MNIGIHYTAFEHIRDHDWLRAEGLFVAEGRYVASRLITSSRIKAVALLVTPTARAAMADAIETSTLDDAAILVRERSELDRLTGFHLHQGCVALGVRPATEPMLPNGIAAPVLVLDGVRDPDNVGSIIRTAAALGGGGLLLGPECADPFYRKAVRTSMGAVFTLPMATAPASDWPSTLSVLKAQGRRLIALTTDAPTTLRDVWKGAAGLDVALLLGSEGEGLSPVVRALADVEARIPMTSGADSLNVAVAAAVALYAGGIDPGRIDPLRTNQLRTNQ